MSDPSSPLRGPAPRADTRTAAAGDALLLLATLLTGLMAGFFFAYSVSVVPGLEQTGASAAMQAMQGINRAVRNPVFGLAFFGSAAISALVVAAAAGGWLRRAAMVPAMLYLAGAIAVTIWANVPLNEGLARQDAAAADSTAAMVAYLEAWSRWNDLRSISAGLAFLLYLPLMRPRRISRSDA